MTEGALFSILTDYARDLTLEGASREEVSKLVAEFGAKLGARGDAIRAVAAYYRRLDEVADEVEFGMF